jgi:hypothetical protein
LSAGDPSLADTEETCPPTCNQLKTAPTAQLARYEAKTLRLTRIPKIAQAVGRTGAKPTPFTHGGGDVPLIGSAHSTEISWPTSPACAKVLRLKQE